MSDNVEFQGKTYSKDALSNMNDDNLLELRNLVAENLGVARVKSFKNHDQAVDSTWKALQKFDDTPESELGSGDKKAAKEKAPKTPPGYLKTVMPKRLTKKMFAKIERLRDPEAGKDRSFAWPDYPNGMRVIDAMMDPALHHEKIHWWANQDPPYLRLVEPTDEEFIAARDKWYEDQGLPNPEKEREAEKAKKAEEREAKKAEREAEKVKKAEEREAKKAEREQQRAEEKAKREAEKKARDEAKAAKANS